MKKLFTLVLITLLTVGFTKAQTVLFSEDFSGGIPATWTNTGTSNGTQNNWVKWRTTTTGAHGAYSASYGNITSPTVANGVAIFDSDSLDNGGHTLANGQPDQTRGPANSPHHCELTTPAISVAGHPFLRLQFYQYLANFQAVTYVGISPDGSTWTYDTLNSGQAVNSATVLGKEKIDLDITGIVNGGNNVYVRFVFDGQYYDWQIDDISIIELPNSDLAVKTSQGVFGASKFNLFYSKIPQSQFGAGNTDSFQVLTTYGNIGRASQPNDVATFNEIKATTSIATHTSTPIGSLAYGVDTFAFTGFTTTGIGSYRVAISVASDSTDYDPTNNVDTVGFSVTDSIYSINSSKQNNSIAYFLIRSNAGATFRLGNLFEVTHDDTLTSITTAIEGGTTGTHAGAVIQASIYPVVDTVIQNNRTLYYNNIAISTFQKTLSAGNITASNAAAVTDIVMPVDLSTGNPVLTPGLYWVAVQGISPAPGDSIVLAATTPYQNGGFPIVEQNNTLFFLSQTEATYCNMNFGRMRSLLYASFVWTPTVPYQDHQVTFNCNNTNAGPAATYRWDINGLNTGTQLTLTGKTPTTTFTVADSFYVCLTVTDGSDSVQTCKWVKVRPNTGINEVNSLSAALTPNPTTGLVKITADDVNGKVAISITNTLGEQVKQMTEDANGSFSKSYNLSDLSSGMYIVKIQNGTNSTTKRLSIVK